MKKTTPFDRLNYSGNIKPIIKNICAIYKIGRLISFSMITTGYEDCNIIIKTSRGKYVAKFFAKTRSLKDIIRYVTIMEKVARANINHPLLLKNNGDILYYNYKMGVSLVLMKFVDGKTFKELRRAPNANELRLIINQAAKINKLNHRPSYLSDAWAIPNIKKQFNKVKKYLNFQDFDLVTQVIKKYSKIPIKTLTHCFVHGDLIKTNILNGDDKKIYVLDFSVANWYPRIQEIAVMAANLLYDDKKSSTLKERIELILKNYDKINPLTTLEKKYIYDYALAGAAMELLGAYKEKYLNNDNGRETNFWLKLGRNNLQKELYQ